MVDGGPWMTIRTQLVLRALLEDPARELYGVEIDAAAGLPSGTVHPILARAYRPSSVPRFRPATEQP